MLPQNGPAVLLTVTVVVAEQTPPLRLLLLSRAVNLNFNVCAVLGRYSPLESCVRTC